MQLDWTILRSGEQIMYRLRGLYERYGYRRFKMSKFEEYDLYVRNKDFLVSDRMITFTDARGILMALKPDVTLSIIKNTRAEEAGPRKVYYNESVYRSGQGEETFQEIMQTGLECIGELDLYHIYEVIALAVESLRAIHPDYVLDVSHMGLVSGFMEAAGVTEAEYPEVMTAVRAKNLAGLEDFCRRRGLSGTVQALLELEAGGTLFGGGAGGAGPPVRGRQKDPGGLGGAQQSLRPAEGQRLGRAGLSGLFCGGRHGVLQRHRLPGLFEKFVCGGALRGTV